MRGIRPFSSVPQVDVSWYYFPRIPIGCITLVFGAAGLGKSTMMYDILARASRGDRMPLSAEYPKPPADLDNARSVIVGTEDTPSRVASVLEAAGADMDSIGIVDQEEFPDPSRSPIEQIEFLESQVKVFGAKVLYVDNVGEAMLSSTDTNKEHSVRQALHPLDSMAKRLGISVIMVTHPKKQGVGGGGDIREMITGSQAFTNLARSVIYVAEVPDSPGLVALSVAKSSYYPAYMTNTIAFKVISESFGEHDGHQLLGVPQVQWEPGILNYTAQSLYEANAAARSAAQSKAMKEALNKPVPIPTFDEMEPPTPLRSPKMHIVAPSPAPAISSKDSEASFMGSETNEEFFARMKSDG